MANIINEQTVDEIISVEISDESLEVAARAGNAGAYTQFGLCTVSFCPGIKRQERDFSTVIDTASTFEMRALGAENKGKANEDDAG
jgi:hypothetical protein